MLAVMILATIAAQPPTLTPMAETRGTTAACPEAAWVSLSPNTPYAPAVADVASVVWLPNLLMPCPSLFLGVGLASLKAPLPTDSSATGVALGHSVAIACCGLPLAASVIGLPLVALETMWVAPVSVLNALDRDVKCAARNSPGAPPPPPKPAPPSSLVPPSSSPLPSSPSPSRGDPLPLPSSVQEPTSMVY